MSDIATDFGGIARRMEELEEERKRPTEQPQGNEENVAQPTRKPHHCPFIFCSTHRSIWASVMAQTSPFGRLAARSRRREKALTRSSVS